MSVRVTNKTPKFIFSMKGHVINVVVAASPRKDCPCSCCMPGSTPSPRRILAKRETSSKVVLRDRQDPQVPRGVSAKTACRGLISQIFGCSRKNRFNFVNLKRELIREINPRHVLLVFAGGMLIHGGELTREINPRHASWDCRNGAGSDEGCWTKLFHGGG